MPIKDEGDFLRWRDAPYVPSLGIQSGKLQKCIAQVKSEQVKGVFGSPGFGFSEDNLDFLDDIPSVESSGSGISH